MNGTESVTARVLRRIRRLVPPHDLRTLIQRFRRLSGIEIGGPSAVFRRWNLWPLYPVIATLDTYNFATHTIWTRPATSGWHPSGRQLVGEASTMTEIGPASYDFLLASHVLEHIANPLQALDTWRRVVRPGGLIVLVVPHRDGTFDHRRPVTPLEHLVKDFERGVNESDETHLEEILALHDLDRDPGAGGREAFVARARRNVEQRSLHHHVFDTHLVLRTVDRVGLSIVYVEVALPYHICVACSTTAPDANQEHISRGNAEFWSPMATWRARDPFPSDRQPRTT